MVKYHSLERSLLCIESSRKWWIWTTCKKSERQSKRFETRNIPRLRSDSFVTHDNIRNRHFISIVLESIKNDIQLKYRLFYEQHWFQHWFWVGSCKVDRTWPIRVWNLFTPLPPMTLQKIKMLNKFYYNVLRFCLVWCGSITDIVPYCLYSASTRVVITNWYM